MKKIEILCTSHTATHGTLTQGRVLMVADDFAAHLVDDCRAARYATSKKSATPGGDNKMDIPDGEDKGGKSKKKAPVPDRNEESADVCTNKETS